MNTLKRHVFAVFLYSRELYLYLVGKALESFIKSNNCVCVSVCVCESHTPSGLVPPPPQNPFVLPFQVWNASVSAYVNPLILTPHCNFVAVLYSKTHTRRLM